MAETYYKRDSDGNFSPASYYNSNILDSIPVNSATLIVHKDYSIVQTYDVDFAMAPLLAGCEYLRGAMVEAIAKIDKVSPPTQAMTEQENDAWNKLIAIGGEGFRRLSKPSTNELINAGVKELTTRMEHVLSDPTCADAYNQFKMCVKLKLEKDNIV